MLNEKLSIVDVASPLWDTVRPLLDAMLRLEQADDAYVWHGWKKARINAFLKNLPAHCTLLAGVWDTYTDEQEAEEQEILVLGCVCEVKEGEICSVRTFKALEEAGLPSVKELEPGFEHAVEIMRATKKQVAPVAWALFTDKASWDEWLFADTGDDSSAFDKGELLAALARQGRCVLMGSQTAHHHP